MKNGGADDLRTDQRRRQGVLQSCWYRLIMSAVIIALLGAGTVIPAEAASSRMAKVVEVKGTVTVKKAGGTKTYKAFKNMSLNKGDWIATDDESSVILSVVDYDDEITVGENSELYLSELQDALDGKQTDINILSGTVYVKAKSLTKDSDSFTVSTPTAIMGVRGTQFLVTVDGRSGDSRVFVASGKVYAEPRNEGDPAALADRSAWVYPAMQGSFYDQTSGVSVIDPDSLIFSLSPEIVAAIIRNKAQMDREHDQFMDEQHERMQQGMTDGVLERLKLDSEADLENYKQNLHSLVNLIAKKAMDLNMAEEAALRRLVDQVNEDLNRPIDLNDPHTFVWDNRLRQELEQLNKQEEQRKRQLEEEAKRRMDQNRQLLDKLEEQRERLARENERAMQERRKQLEEEYKSRLSDQEKVRFEENQKSRDGNLPLPFYPVAPSPTSKPPVDPGAIVRIEDLTRSVNWNEAFTLPATVDAEMSNGSTRQVSVEWNPATVDTSVTGTYTYEGTVKGYGSKVKLTLTVTAPLDTAIPIKANQPIVFAGGVVLDFGAASIPPGATITLRSVQPVLPSGGGMAVAGPVIDFQLNGFTITEPVLVQFPLDPNAEASAAGIFYERSEGEWEYIPTTVRNGTASAWVNHFSVYGALTAPQVEKVTSIPEPGLIEPGTEITLQSSKPDALIYYKQGDRYVRYESNRKPSIPQDGHALEAYAASRNMRDSDPVRLSYSTAEAKVLDDSRIAVTFPDRVTVGTEPISDWMGVLPRVTQEGGQSYLLGVWPTDSAVTMPNAGAAIASVESVKSNGLILTLQEDAAALPQQSYEVRFYKRLDNDRQFTDYVARSNPFPLGGQDPGSDPGPDPDPDPDPVGSFVIGAEAYENRAILEWERIEAAERYKIYLNGVLHDEKIQEDFAFDTLFYSFDTLEFGQEYMVKIEAWSPEDRLLAVGEVVFETESLDDLAVNIDNTASDSITISWEDYIPDYGQYRIYLDDEEVESRSAGELLQYTFRDLLPATEYRIRVEAWMGGRDAPSAAGELTVITTEEPEPIDSIEIMAEPYENIVNLGWGRVEGAENYIIYLNDVLYDEKLQEDSDTIYHYIQSLEFGQVYAVRIEARGLDNRLLAMGETIFETRSLDPITINIESVTFDSIMISWEAYFPDFHGVYRIYLNDELAYVSADEQLQYIFTGLSPETQYRIRVAAYEGGDFPSAEGEETIQTPPNTTAWRAPIGHYKNKEYLL
ncbi:Ig-like domain-containing protein [Paenibacillus sp. J2TS4]|uniref:Ig-like domain-containing protein n=1 Tax=Paenibacillus sp. J2TS4 TaxID=2807194 RepID=UPI001B090C05|nr:Ig-like domain-containing protein [Paenibacillus sp. J2TS4]GIP33347.1 hypothetical protein J2TS4_25570 [Paenibacillus sp. J2TS4]